LGIALLTGALLRFTLPLALTTLVAFIVAVSINLRRGRSIRCGCFGDDDERISGRSLARLGEMLSGSLILLLAYSHGTAAITLDDLVSDRVGAITYVAVIAPVAAFFILSGLWLLEIRELAALVRAGSGHVITGREG
jgi:hypothetical protein